jgi:hypothetical protein
MEKRQKNWRILLGKKLTGYVLLGSLAAVAQRKGDEKIDEKQKIPGSLPSPTGATFNKRVMRDQDQRYRTTWVFATGKYVAILLRLLGIPIIISPPYHQNTWNLSLSWRPIPTLIT